MTMTLASTDTTASRAAAPTGTGTGTRRQGLAPEEVAALNLATHVQFLWLAGTASIVAEHRLDPENRPLSRGPRGTCRSVFPEETGTGDLLRRRRIDCAGAVSAARWTHAAAPHALCSYSLVAAEHELWHTLRGLLYPGDTLTLRWQADLDTAAVRAAGLHTDALRVEVVHRHRARVYLLACVTDGDEGRMIRRHG